MLKEFIWHVLIRYLITILVPLATRIGDLVRTKRQINKQTNEKQTILNVYTIIGENFQAQKIVAQQVVRNQQNRIFQSCSF